MPGYSIGLLETKKYAIALKALDSMLKTSKVKALDKKVITGDFVTVFIEGELSAVRSALDVGILKVKREGEICLAYLLENPYPGFKNLI
jgi:microcompartment protein CcmL/EutN